MNDTLNTPENCIAALDIGSNSFHFVLARIVDQNLQILHSEKYSVKLADGLDQENMLSKAAINRGLAVLSQLADMAEQLTTDNFRIVATYTLRKAKNAHQFLSQAQKILPFDIEVISGHEEARLIYQGVSHYVASDTKHLVLDIGGGSTECIVGKNNKITFLDSIDMGCVSFSRSYFPEGDISDTAFKHAVLHASLEIEAVASGFTRPGWQTAYGTSGTIKSIYQIINYGQELPQPIQLSQLYQLRSQLIAAKHVSNININGLKDARIDVICPGLAILIALMEVLRIKELDYCDYALREGVLFGLLDQKLSSNIHNRTITSLMTRFNVDVEQIERVKTVAKQLFKQLKEPWQLSGKHYENLLYWAISLHEIGLDINPAGFHRHGRYIIENADLAGFNQEQVQALAWLVGSQRRKIQALDNMSWFLIKPLKLASILVIFRIACLLNKKRQLANLPDIKLSTKHGQLFCHFPKTWLAENPLIVADLHQEQQQLKAINIELVIR